MTKAATDHAPAVNDEEEDTRPPRDPFFNPYRVPKGDNVKAIVATVLQQLGHYEDHFEVRRRARRPADQTRYERIVAAIVADLAHRRLLNAEQTLTVSLSKAVLGRAGRYTSPVLSKTLRDILYRMAAPEMAFVEVQKGTKGNPFAAGRRTTIAAGKRLSKLIDTADVQLCDLREDLDQETVVLKDARIDYWTKGRMIDYADTPATDRYRAELREINEWLDDAEIDVDEFVSAGTWLVDGGDRLLRRYFNNGSFEEGGRIFGGFWQRLKKAQRRESISISGEPVVTLDYGQMTPRILYGMVGVQPPEGDAYRIPGYEDLYRAGIKTVFAALTFSGDDLATKPKDTKARLPNRPIKEITAAIRAHHVPIAALLGTRIGHRVSFHESQILVDVLLRLKRKGIVALPIHDAVVIPESREDETRQIMLDAFRDHLGVDGRVDTE